VIAGGWRESLDLLREYLERGQPVRT
jgi:hypothetical protein